MIILQLQISVKKSYIFKGNQIKVHNQRICDIVFKCGFSNHSYYIFITRKESLVCQPPFRMPSFKVHWRNKNIVNIYENNLSYTNCEHPAGSQYSILSPTSLSAWIVITTFLFVQSAFCGTIKLNLYTSEEG